MGFGDGSGLVAGMPNPAGSLFTRRPRRSRAQDAAAVGYLDGFSNLCFLSWWKDGLRRCLCGGRDATRSQGTELDVSYWFRLIMFFWETPMRASPVEFKLVLQFPFVLPSPLRPADYKSALVRPRWRVVSTVKVRAGVIP